MKTKVSLKMFVLSVVLLMTSFVASARSYDGQLVYNPVEENGVMVGQTVYKMNGSTLANYMKYNYKYDDNKRMIESDSDSSRASGLQYGWLHFPRGSRYLRKP